MTCLHRSAWNSRLPAVTAQTGVIGPPPARSASAIQVLQVLTSERPTSRTVATASTSSSTGRSTRSVDVVILYPVQTAANLVAYETGDFDARDVRRLGLVILVLATLLIVAVMLPYWRAVACR